MIIPVQLIIVNSSNPADDTFEYGIVNIRNDGGENFVSSLRYKTYKLASEAADRMNKKKN